LRRWDLTRFDAIVLDASLFNAGCRDIGADLLRVIRNHDGCKIALLRDVQWNRRVCAFLEKLRVDTVVTNVVESDVRKDWAAVQRMPDVVAWNEGKPEGVAVTIGEVMARAKLKKPCADLPIVPAMNDEEWPRIRSEGPITFVRIDGKDRIARLSEDTRMGAADAKDVHPLATLLPNYTQSSELKLIGTFLLRALVSAFFFCWDSLPNSVRVPIVALIPKRVREAMRRAAPKISVR